VCILVDCLTLWLSNLLGEGDEALAQQRSALLDSFASLPGRIILVSNEVGMGIIPMGELSRRFVDEAGRLHQQLAQQCDTVTLMVAGLPYPIKPPTE
jgi:adenosylcobinamide kinase/adenosylcobinamide-phosphate guanylyltransferase